MHGGPAVVCFETEKEFEDFGVGFWADTSLFRFKVFFCPEVEAFRPHRFVVDEKPSVFDRWWTLLVNAIREVEV